MVELGARDITVQTPLALLAIPCYRCIHLYICLPLQLRFRCRFNANEPDWRYGDCRGSHVMINCCKSSEAEQDQNIIHYNTQLFILCKLIYPGYITFYTCCNCIPQDKVWQHLQSFRPKDPVGKDRVVGPVYKISCEYCEATYIGKTERSLKARFGKHRRPSSTTSEVSRHIHSDNPNHNITL